MTLALPSDKSEAPGLRECTGGTLEGSHGDVLEQVPVLVLWTPSCRCSCKIDDIFVVHDELRHTPSTSKCHASPKPG